MTSRTCSILIDEVSPGSTEMTSGCMRRTILVHAVHRPHASIPSVGGSFVPAPNGMGGHNAGEVASRIAIETVRMFLQKSAADHDCTWPFGVNPTLSFATNRLITAVKLANRRVFRDSEERVEYTGMGTTLVVALAQ